MTDELATITVNFGGRTLTFQDAVVRSMEINQERVSPALGVNYQGISFDVFKHETTCTVNFSFDHAIEATELAPEASGNDDEHDRWDEIG